MLEKEAALRTWRLVEQPDEWGPIEAQPLADHRLAYLNYEGPVSGHRGSVRRFDKGEYTLIDEDEGHVVVELCGAVLQGKAVVEHDKRTARFTFVFTPHAEH